MDTNQQVLAGIGRRAAGANRAVETGDLTGTGALTQEEVTAFITAFQDVGELNKLVQWKKVGAKSGNLPRLSFGSRLLRAKQEMVAPESLVDPTPSTVAFALAGTRLAYEIPEEVIEYNVEGEGYMVEVFTGMSNAFGNDLMDLGLNGNTATDPGDPYYKFLKVLNGWLRKLVTGGGNVVDAAGISGGSDIGKDIFFATKQALPAKWKNRLDRYRWIMHPDFFDAYMRELAGQVGSAADQALVDGRTKMIVGVNYVLESKMPTDELLLADPSQMAMCYNRNMKFRTTDQGIEAVAEDKRYSVLLGDYDPIWFWEDSAVLTQGVTNIV